MCFLLHNTLSANILAVSSPLGTYPYGFSVHRVRRLYTVKSNPLFPQCVLIDLVSIGSKTQQDFILVLHMVVHNRDSLMTRCVSKGKLAATLTMWSMVFVSKFFVVARMWVALTQRWSSDSAAPDMKATL